MTRDRLLTELRELSRELIALGSPDLAALVEDARVRAWRSSHRRGAMVRT